MPYREPGSWMWAEACELLDRAERLHRQFFQPSQSLGKHPGWEPPIDIIETEREFWVWVALPGVEPDRLEVFLEPGVLIVTGQRSIPIESRPVAIHRLEIPYGRFHRRIDLPQRRLKVGNQVLANGCLQLRLRKL